MKKPNFFDYLNYFMSQAAILKLTGNDYLLYLNILKAWNRQCSKNPVEIPTKSLNAMTKLFNSSISRSRDKLVIAGLIKVRAGNGRSDVPQYTLCLPSDNFDCTDATENATEITSDATGNATEITSDATGNAIENTTDTASVATENATENATETQISPIYIKTKKLNNYIDDDNARNFSDYFSEFFSDKNKGFIEQFAMSINASDAEVKTLAKTAIAEWRLSGITHPDYSDWAKHLMNVIRIKRFAAAGRTNSSSNFSTSKNISTNDSKNTKLTLDDLNRMSTDELAARFGEDARYEFGRQYIISNPSLFGIQG